MRFPPHKTRIVCTIGPSSDSPQVLERMIRRGMDVARLNLAHGDAASHSRMIYAVRAAAARAGKRIAILVDLPGPKIRVGELAVEPVELVRGGHLVLTSAPIIGDVTRISVSLPDLVHAVHPGDAVFLNDGFIRLRVDGVDGGDVHCRIMVGGPLRSHKGVNLPGADLGSRAVTDEDLEHLAFAGEHGVDAVSVSFVCGPEDILTARRAAAASGYAPFLIAKIERAVAIERFADILGAADGIMVARGDLGVETPIEEIALVQKRLIRAANRAGKPVITATQMLESMTNNSRPTRAESTDVANAVLDGTDAVMLSEESAVGEYPVEAVAMLSRIARVAEAYRLSDECGPRDIPKAAVGSEVAEAISLNVVNAAERLHVRVILTPTETGATPRRISRYKPRPWIVALSQHESTCQRLQLSYGVYPVRVGAGGKDWKVEGSEWCARQGISSGLAVITQGAAQGAAGGTNRMEVFAIGENK